MEIDGYFAETPYPPHFPRAFSPACIDHVLRLGGYRPPRTPRGAFRYLDLGCGNGLHLLLMAAGCPEGTFVGTDANAPAMERVQALAEGLEVPNVTFHAETFAQTLERVQPGFDYVVGLGLLSWVSPANRTVLCRIAGRALNPGGAAAFGYNTLPGRAPELLVQRMILDHVRASDQPQPDAIRAALDQVRNMAEAGALGLQSPRITAILQVLDQVDRDFLPHEYISEHWAPLHAADVIRALEAEGMAYAGALNLVENRPDFVLRTALRPIVAAEPDIAARQRMIDLATNQVFRRDLYVRQPAAQHDTKDDRDAAWIAATGPASAADLSLATSGGRLRFDNRAARGMLEALEAGPKTVAEAGAPVSRADRLNTLDALLAAELVVPVEPPAEIAASKLNGWLARRAADGLPTLMAQATRHGALAIPPAVVRTLGAGGDPDPATAARFTL